jgi:Carboxypeptidase regulatory-like domain/TonB-dependent Receptor Plug Domain
MQRRLLSVVLAAVCVCLASAPAFAQGGSSTSSIAGTVLDASGGTVPGATIEAKNVGTGATLTAVSGAQGGFTFPAVQTGKYSVTVTLSGFKTVVLNDVDVTVGQPVTLQVKLEVGGLSEKVTVEGATPLVQTQQTSVSATINTKQIESLPLTSRNVIDFLTFMPGVNVASSNRNANVNGLPGSAVNITLDGVNIQDNTLKSSDGFFTIVVPRLDSIEEVTITGAASGVADSQGAISVKFVTRSGTNTYTGSAYNYYRSDKLNKNTWFNYRNGVAIAKLKNNQTGARVGGPIVLPGLFDGRSRAFFFTNIEYTSTPAEVTRRRTILNPQAQTGIFSYTTASGVQSVDLMALAAANGQLASIDPTIQKLLADIRTAAGTTGTITNQTNPLFQDFNYNVLQSSTTWYPTVRVDFNFTPSHRLSSVYNHQVFSTIPDATTNSFDATFPGFPNSGSQTSKRISVSNTFRSTIGTNIVNEARFGVQGSPVQFFPEQRTAAPWSGTLANQKGFQLNLGNGLTNAGPGPNAQSRNAKVYTYEDTLNWLKGNHAISGGVSVTDLRIWLENVIPVPTVTFGIQANDPAAAFLISGNFPGSAQTDVTSARALYATLTGRITQISGNARINESSGEYVYGGPAIQRGRMMEVGTYVNDTWRVKPNLTFNYGLRYEVQGAFSPDNSLYSYVTAADAFGVSGMSSTCDPVEPTAATCNLFKNGYMPGTVTQFKQYTAGTKAYNTDYNNWAPSFGVNWTPSVTSGFLRTLTGEPGEFSVRGGWTRGYLRNGLNDFTGVFNGNPGIRINLVKSEQNGNLGSNLVLLRNDSQTGPPSFPLKPTYPFTGVTTDSVNAFADDLRVPYADTYTAGVQRGLGKKMAVEVRYVGTRSRDSITTYNLNGEVNINENGFLNEFKNAMANLQANVAAGIGATAGFKYMGPGTGTVPLPIYAAYFNRLSGADVNNAALYTGANWTSTTFTNSMAKFNPNPFTNANNLGGTAVTAANKANALAAGIPANFFLANPDYTGGASIRGNGGYTRFNSMQLELRRRYANGFQFNGNYVYGIGIDSQRFSFRKPRLDVRQTGGGGEVTHALKGNIVFDLPFGRGHHFMADAGPVMDRIVGGWQLNMNFRMQTGRLIDFGNVRMIGFNEKDLQEMFKLRIDANNRVYMLPADLINESIKAFSVSATSATGYGSLGAPSGKYFAPASGPDCIESIAQGYGDCGERTLVVRGPVLKESDMSLVKSVAIKGNMKAEFRIEALNVFNNVNFTPIAGVGSTTLTGYELSGLTSINNARVIQLVTRFNW